jgi:type VI secretion system secreted protein VgrG
VGNSYSITVADELTITVGKSVLNMKKDGTISLNGMDISVMGDGEINVKAAKDIVMKGKNILEN